MWPSDTGFKLCAALHALEGIQIIVGKTPDPDHRFLTGGSVDLQGVHKDHKSKVLYPFKLLLYGVSENLFDFYGPTDQKKVKNPCTRPSFKTHFFLSIVESNS